VEKTSSPPPEPPANPTALEAAPATPDGSAMILDVNDIQRILPHRPPFLLVDRIIELEPRKRIVGIKNVTINEPFFVGHFPSFPVMPGVLIVEAMAQTGGVLVLGELKDRPDKLVFFASIESAKFRRPVRPGDQIRLEVEVLSMKTSFCRMQGNAYVDEKLAAEAIILCKLLERSDVPA
jgi:3-hydroxyacyl-[acyl-carrier-protein] dehydratase